MLHYALIGHPLGHSLSPEIHRRLFLLEDLCAEYSLLDIPPNTLATHLPLLQNLTAFNVTIPYKQTIIPYLQMLDPAAQLYGAVNAVHSKDGQLIGSNTDCGGFLETMAAHAIPLDGRICILGAGGVGRMFAIACVKYGASVTVAARKSSGAKSEILAYEISEKFHTAISLCEIESLCGHFDLLINATPVGMFPHQGITPVSDRFLTDVDTVFDCIYNPSETLLLHHAAALGKKTISGMEMLVRQAVIAHENWHGTHFTDQTVARLVTEMTAYLLQKEQAL